jgi:hypothetical protein
MGWLQLGRKLETEQVNFIVTFLRTLTDKPRANAAATVEAKKQRSRGLLRARVVPILT